MQRIVYGICCLAIVAATAQQAPRFDHVVRGDFFAGLAGNTEAFERAMTTAAKIIEADPRHAEALVWHGSGLLLRSGQIRARGDAQAANEMFGKGLAQMQQAVELQPEHIGVRAPRGATLLTASRFVPPQFGRSMLADAVADYEKILELQRAYFHKVGAHPKGELLLGLADGHERLGDRDKARSYYEWMAKDLPGTPYENKAKSWLAEGKLPAAEYRCTGCHVSGK